MARTAAHSLTGIKDGASAARDQPVPFVENATGSRNIISQFSCTRTGRHLSSKGIPRVFFDQLQTSENRHPKTGIITGEAP
jgi:hypothetical protein